MSSPYVHPSNGGMIVNDEYSNGSSFDVSGSSLCGSDSSRTRGGGGRKGGLCGTGIRISNRVLYLTLAVLSSLACYDLWRQYYYGNEAYWYMQYARAVRDSPEMWTLGYRIERLVEGSAQVRQMLLDVKQRVAATTPSFKPVATSSLPETSSSGSTNGIASKGGSNNVAKNTKWGAYVSSAVEVDGLLVNSSSYFHLRCGDNLGLLRLGVSDYRADPRDACQMFVGALSDIRGPENVFERVDTLSGDGSFALRSLSSGLYLTVVPPPLDITSLAAPWKIVASSAAVSSAETFFLTEESALFSALMGGVIDCSGGSGQMVRGFPGASSSFSVLELEQVPSQQLAKYRQMKYASDLIMERQAADLRRARQDRARAELAKEQSSGSRGGEGSTSAIANKTVTKIVLGIPMTSRKTNMVTIQDSPLWVNLFDSFLDTVDWLNSDAYHFAFYLGFDKSDPIYDTGDAWSDLRAEFATRARRSLELQLMTPEQIEEILAHRLAIKLFHFEHLEGAPSQVVSQLMLYAYRENFDFFYQVNDDTRFDTMNWADVLIAALSNPDSAVPYLGVTGPVDSNNDKIFTHSFVHRTHFDIFGTLFPASFKNWWSDDWISAVYGREYTYWPRASAVQISHLVSSHKAVGAGYTRYEVDKGAQLRLNGELRAGFVKINEWLRKHSYPSLPLPDICNYAPAMKYIYPRLVQQQREGGASSATTPADSNAGAARAT